MKNLTPKQSTCKKLTEAGWEKKTKFYWRQSYTGSDKWYICRYDQLPLPNNGIGYYEAPLTDELLGELPDDIMIVREGSYTVSCSVDRRYILEDKSLVEALAQLWLILKKEKLI